MEWNKLGELLGSSLGAGLNTYGDISLQRKAQQQEFDQRKQIMLEQESARQRALQAKQQEQARIAKLYGDLALGRDPFQNQAMPENGEMPNMQPGQAIPPMQQGMMPKEGGIAPQNNGQMQTQGKLSLQDRLDKAIAAGLGPNEISKLQMAWEKEEANNLKREEMDYKKQQDYLRSIERKQSQENAFRNKKELTQLSGINKLVAENYTNKPILKEKRNNYKDLVDIAKNPESLRIGKGRQILDKFGLGNFWQAPLSDVVDKLVSRIIVNESQTTHGATANTIQGLENIKASVPNLMQNPEAFESIANALYYTSEAQYIESKELDRLSAKGVNLDTIAERDRITKPKTKELHKRSRYALSLASVPVPIDFSSAIKHQPEIQFLYELPPIEEAPVGKAAIDKKTGVRLIPRNGKWVVEEKKGR